MLGGKNTGQSFCKNANSCICVDCCISGDPGVTTDFVHSPGDAELQKKNRVEIVKYWLQLAVVIIIGGALGGRSMTLKNSFQLVDIAEIAAKLIDPGPGNELALIIIVGGPGVGKTTLAREFARQTNSIHFEIDEVKRQIVPEEIAAKNIDSPEYRYKYYAEAIRRLPHFFAQSTNN